MSTVWNTYRIEDIADKITIGPFGSRMKSDAYVESGVPVIRGTNLTGSKKFSGDWVFISEQLAKQLENCCVSNGDLVFPHRGSIGEVGLVDNQFHQYMMSSSLMKLRCNPNIADSEFIYYFFKSHQGRYELLKNASQVGTPGIGQPLTSLKNIEIKLPSLGEQRKIAKILSDLDDKIHINNQINQTLESIAQALFKSWFVDFDPVRAKIAAKQEGKDAELAAMCAISGKSETELEQMAEDDFAELQATAALFPDELVESELGEVPKGWDATALGNFLEIKRGGSPRPIQNFMAPTGYPWVKIADATADPSPFLFKTKEFIIKEGLKKTVYLKKGSLILTNSATPGLPKFLELDACIHDGWLYFPQKKHFSDNYLYFLFLKLRTQLVAQGNGSVFTNLKTDILRNQVVLVPTREVIEKFDLQVGKILKMMKTQCIQSSNLSDLRDTLLPKLLSGELDATLLKE